MDGSPVRWFFGVVARPATWLNVLYQWLAFPLGLFYFIFLVVGISVGFGLLVIWVGIPILLIVAGAWWLFGAFERVQARYLLRADVAWSVRSWEDVDGVWAKLKAHFGSGATWRDLLFLLAKLPFGIVGFTLSVTLLAVVGFLFSFPAAWYWHLHFVDFGNGRVWTPPLWLAILGVPLGVLMFLVALHILNGWGWVCARWAELLFGLRRTATTPAGAAVLPPPAIAAAVAPPAAAAVSPAPWATPPLPPQAAATAIVLREGVPAPPVAAPAPVAEAAAPQVASALPVGPAPPVAAAPPASRPPSDSSTVTEE